MRIRLREYRTREETMFSNKRQIFLFLATLLTAGVVVGCGPTYPNCETDEHCEETSERCVETLCKECAGDNDCTAKDACSMCGPANSCEPRPGCCQSDLDCPGGRCWRVSGSGYGECGGRCRTEGSAEDCNSGELCRGGQCVPDDSCTDSSQCAPGKACIQGHCVNACNLETVYYDFNESTLRQDARATLQTNAECVAKRGQNVLVEGHSDERGTDEYNMALGERRARGAVKYLEKLGASVGIRTISYGEERPVCNESNENCWWRNRRAENIFE